MEGHPLQVPVGEHGQQVFVLLKLIAQERNGGAGLFHLSLQSEHIIRDSLTETHPILGYSQLFFLRTKDGLHRLNLCSQIGPGNRCSDNTGR